MPVENTLIIPEPNPIRFFEQEAPDCYAQKYAPVDFTNLQLASVGLEFSVFLTIKDSYNRDVRTLYPRQPNAVLNGDYFFYTFDIDFFGLAGNYRFIITGSAPGATTQYFYSGCINVSSKNVKNTLLQYRHTRNKDDVNYSEIEIFALRTEGGFLPKNYNPKSEDSVFQNQTVDFELLHSDTYFTRYFTAGGPKGIPDDFHYIIHKAWGNNRVFVNGKGYTKYNAGSEWDVNEIDQYALRTWKFEVVRTNRTYTRPVDVTTTSEWGGYVCRIVDGKYTGYAAATTLTVNKMAGNFVVSGYPKIYNILSAFVYDGVVYPVISASDYAALSDADLYVRRDAFIGYVQSNDGVFTVRVNLINAGYNLINAGYNLISSSDLSGAFEVKNSTCMELPQLYLGVTESGNPTESEIKSLSTMENTNGDIEYSFVTPTLMYAQVWEPETNNPFVDIQNDVNDSVMPSFNIIYQSIDGAMYRGYIYKYPTIDPIPYRLRFFKA